MHVKDSNDTSKTRHRRNKSEPMIKQNRGHSSSQHEFDSTTEKYENTPSDVDIKHPDEHQIKLDTDRSFVLYSVGETIYKFKCKKMYPHLNAKMVIRIEKSFRRSSTSLSRLCFVDIQSLDIFR